MVQTDTTALNNNTQLVQADNTTLNTTTQIVQNEHDNTPRAVQTEKETTPRAIQTDRTITEENQTQTEAKQNDGEGNFFYFQLGFFSWSLNGLPKK